MPNPPSLLERENPQGKSISPLRKWSFERADLLPFTTQVQLQDSMFPQIATPERSTGPLGKGKAGSANTESNGVLPTSTPTMPPERIIDEQIEELERMVNRKKQIMTLT